MKTIKIKRNYQTLFYIFLLHCGIAFLALLGQLISNGGLYILCDDFSDQQLPFTMLINDAVKSGSLGFNWSIDIGSDLISSMGFYSIASPFLWLTLLFPKNAFPYLTAWILILKYGVAGVTSFLFFKRFVKDKKYAVLASMLYTFSGYQCTNLIFYNFHDVVAFFPLLLLGLEKLTEENKKGWLAFAVAVNVFVNYYFFTQEVIFLILYFLCKNGIFSVERWKQIGKCFMEGILGIGMAAAVLLPCIVQTMANTRAGRMIPKEAWFDTGRRYFLQLIRVFLFPAEAMGRPSCVEEIAWSSWSAYLPMVGICLAACYVIRKKWDWLARIMMLCLIFAVIPILNSMFGLFAESNYKRWYFMLLFLMSLASAKVMEDSEQYPAKWVTGICAVFMIFVTAVFPWWDQHKFQLIFGENVFWFLSVTGILGVVCLWLMLCFIQQKERRYWFLLTGIALFSIITTSYTSTIYEKEMKESSTGNFETPQDYYDRITAYQQFTLPQEGYRIATVENSVTIPSSLPGTGSFHSTVSGSIFAFYEAIEEQRFVFSPEPTEEVNRLLSGKYEITEELRENQEPIQTAKSKTTTYYMYEKEDILPIGFVYQTFMVRSRFDQLEQSEKAGMMLHTLIIPDEEQNTVQERLLPYEFIDTVQDTAAAATANTADHAPGIRESSESFEVTKSGFQASIPSKTGGYAFFSVPFEKGFKAKVNGESVPIMNSNGMMAVPVCKGSNEVTFTYLNPMLILGILISMASLGCTLLYVKVKINE